MMAVHFSKPVRESLICVIGVLYIINKIVIALLVSQYHLTLLGAFHKLHSS